MNLIKEYGLKEDKRMAQATKELIIFLISFVILSIWVWYWGFVGANQDPLTYTYILGFPKWLFMAAVGTVVVYPICLVVQALLIKDCPLTADGKEEGEADQQKTEK